MDYLILLLAGACLGSIVKVKDQSFGADAYTYTIIAVCKSRKFSVTPPLLEYFEFPSVDLFPENFQ